MISIYRYKGKENSRSIEAYNNFLRLLKQNNHVLLSDYINASTKVLIKFQCEHEAQYVIPYNYKIGRHCSYCKRANMNNYMKEDSFIKLLEMVKRNNHILKSDYIDNKAKVLIDFNCGHEPHWIAPNNYKNGQSCPKCAKTSPEEAYESFLQQLKQNNHVLKSDYIRQNTKVLIDFNCGHSPHWLKPNAYKYGSGCPECNQKSSHGAYMLFLKLLEQNNHKLLSDYINAKTKVLIDFNCGHEPYEMRPDAYKRGYGCPKCNESKGEKIIQKYLNANNVEYKSQYRIITEDINMSRKFYDIYIPSYNLIVEVHGEQHYVENDFFRRTLEEEQKNDDLKKEYALNNGYNYIEIDYKEHNPDLALERFKAKIAELEHRLNGDNF